MFLQKSLIAYLFILVASWSYSQVVVVNITLINTDSGVLAVLSEKLSYNSLIMAEQAIIHSSFESIKNNKREIRAFEYEKNDHDKSLGLSLALNEGINSLIIGTPLVFPSNYPFYHTLAKYDYFTREKIINLAIEGVIVLERNNRIRNLNTQELYALNRNMLTRLMESNRNVYQNSLFIIIASMLSNLVILSESDLEIILGLNL